MPPFEELYAKVLSLKAENENFRAQLAWFQRQVFGGGRSEKMSVVLDAQTSLGLAESAQAERARADG
jgi:hypothetical protein